MEVKIPFSQESLNEIFKISTKNPERVISRESSSLEFKESFGWVNLPKYLKTSAAYANSKGGYIVFGIADKPHHLLGLSGNNLKMFEDIKPEKMSEHFNEHFAPEIEWEIQQYELQGKTFGLLYIKEAKDKPVICIKNSGREILKEGDIYYRYRGRSERIRYSELRAILEARRQHEQEIWMDHIRDIARIGVHEAGIFDLRNGKIKGPGGSLLIEESLLSQISFIKEGDFSEDKGKPVLKIVGQAKSLSGSQLSSSRKQIAKIKGIRIGDIVLGALRREKVPEPHEYVKQVCFESTSFLPVYYFIKKSEMTLDQIIEMLENVISRSQSRPRLIERLKNRSTQELSISSTDTPATIKKRGYADSLRNNKISVKSKISGKELLYCLQAIRSLPESQIRANSKYLANLLTNWFNKHYVSQEPGLADNLRRAICWVDEALNMSDCK